MKLQITNLTNVETTKPNEIQIPEIQISYVGESSKHPKLSSSNEVFELLQTQYSRQTIELREQFLVLYLDHGNSVLGSLLLSIGSTSATVVDIKHLVGVAIKASASGAIISHNHPSGCLSPSEADKMLTNRIQDALRLFDIKLLDHVIMTSQGYFSFADEGLL